MNYITPTNSKQIAKIGYDPATKHMIVEYAGSGRRYEHRNVTKEQYDSFLKAPSLNSAIHKTLGKLSEIKV